MALIKQNEPVYEILVLIPLFDNEGSGKPVQICGLVRAFVPCIHKVWMQMKTQVKIYTSSSTGFVSMGVYRFSDIRDKYQFLMSWPECVILYIFILNLPIQQRIGELQDKCINMFLNPNNIEVIYDHESQLHWGCWL